MSKKILGILELENRPITLPGALCAPGSFPFPVKRLTVPGATSKSVVNGDETLKDAYIRTAHTLATEGATAITTNCGFSAIYQNDVAAAVSVPVALSSLLLVPFMARTLPPGRKIGILTFDANKLEERHFAAAGWSSKDIDIAVIGIEGSETWRQLSDPIPDASSKLILDDVTKAANTLRRREPTVGAFLFECAGFTLASSTVRRETGLPVCDFVNLGNMIASVGID